MPSYRNIPIDSPCFSTVAKPGDKTYCVTIPEINDCGVSENYLWKALNGQKNNTYNYWPHHKEGKTVYLHYSGLKPEYQIKIRETFLDNLTPEEWYKTNGKADEIEERLSRYAFLEEEDEAYFQTATYPSGEKIPAKDLRKAEEACRWLTMFIRLSDKEVLQKVGYKKAADLYEDTALLFKTKGIHLPTAYNKIREKIRSYMEVGAACCIDTRKQGNKNAAKVYTEEQTGLLISLCSKGASYNAEYIAEVYNRIAVAKGWERISGRSVRKYLSEYSLYTEAGRNGSEAFRGKISMQPRRRRPDEALSFWSIDGWTVELLYKKQVKDKKGHTVTTYTNRLVAVIIIDAVNNYPVGVAIGEKETVDLIQLAVKNAIDHCREKLGDYYRPFQIQSDRFGVKSMTSFYEDIAKYFTPARAKNAKSKPVERYNKYLNDEYCQKYFGNTNWSGHNINARKKNQPNIDMLNANKHQFPDKDGVIEQINWIIQEDRKKKEKVWLEA
ncbi:MAG: hypothetical protein LUE98_07665 [Tannerellaceae bacterium]|nr:hypothetical protein [Tannerellaceae bacterium]